ncbi:membrane protein insertase YidC [Catenuloplanes atrovinosus]|uniref:Membrane protein insertase YidC n=1 Tax=Catenuloplanes atrovinosus TaxID=137266 RepID=A0AAE3YUB9_9ACTN|nr:membrane protein insertase YidC [Catenuloplanes atrovinosus]MDR7280054.1 YidC/Oxa1 family membrane protein insertase [Catenuloplanes atrovinosus]
MFDFVNLDPIYWAISWILLKWHAAWDFIGVPDTTILGTNWSWILAIVFLVVTVRVVLFPVFVKQIKSQRAVQALQPQLKALQDKHKGDRETLQKEMVELYRKEKANPLMGCLPMFIQIPVFFGLFHVLRRLDPSKTNKTLYGWTAEQFDGAANAKLFTVPIAGKFGSTTEELVRLGANRATVMVVAGLLVLIMMATTYLTSRQMILKTGWAEDPQQKMIQRLMLYGIPLSLLVSGYLFPIGVIIYWVSNNLVTLAQQQWVLRKFPPPVTATTGKTGGSGASRQSEPVKTGMFGRKSAPAEPAKPAVDTKALAPKPGAKPVRPGRTAQATKAQANGAAPAKAGGTPGKNAVGRTGGVPSRAKKSNPSAKPKG